MLLFQKKYNCPYILLNAGIRHVALNSECCAISKYDIRPNVWVAENRRFVINPLYHVGCAMVVKILNFRLYKIPKNYFLRHFALPNHPKKLSFALSCQDFSWVSTWHGTRKFSNSLFIIASSVPYLQMRELDNWDTRITNYCSWRLQSERIRNFLREACKGSIKQKN